MPTAPGAVGEFYQVWVSPDTDERLQKAGFELHRRGKLLTKWGKPVRLQEGPDGEKRVPKYAIAKYALTLLLQNGKNSQRGKK